MITRTDVENQVKELSNASWFFQSQKSVYDELLRYLEGLHKVINLYGFSGVGKTFLAHVLIKENRVEYISSPELIHTTSLPLIIDNSPFDRTFVRGMRNKMREMELHQVILITRYRVQDSIPAFELRITKV